MEQLLQITLAVIPGLLIGVITAFVSTKLALRRHYSEKWWEKKVLIYSDLMDSLYHMMIYDEEVMKDPSTKQKDEKENEEKLLAQSKTALEKINKLTDLGNFLISQTVARRLILLRKDIETAADTDNWYDYLMKESEAVNRCIQDIRIMSKEDLNIKEVIEMKKVNLVQKIGIIVILFVLSLLTIFHNPFGGYEQTEVLYSKVQFLKMVREGYPEYADISDSSLFISFLKVYPNVATWLKEENNGSEVLPITIKNHETNYKLTPPPAYYGKTSVLRSKEALFNWIDEPSKYFGFVIPVFLFGVIWFILFRDPKNKSAA